MPFRPCDSLQALWLTITTSFPSHLPFPSCIPSRRGDVASSIRAKWGAAACMSTCLLLEFAGKGASLVRLQDFTLKLGQSRPNQEKLVSLLVSKGNKVIQEGWILWRKCGKILTIEASGQKGCERSVHCSSNQPVGLLLLKKTHTHNSKVSSFWPCCGACRILVLRPGVELWAHDTQRWKCWALTTEQPANSCSSF